METNNAKIGWKNWIIIWVVGLAGQLCWNVENQWFNTFIYAKIGPYAWIISWMTAISSIVTGAVVSLVCYLCKSPIYEIIPGFAIATIVLFVVSALTERFVPSKDREAMDREYDTMLSIINKKDDVIAK